MRIVKEIYFVASVFLVLSIFSCQKKDDVQQERVCIIDDGELLNLVQREALTNSMRDIENKLGPQLIIIVLDSLNGVEIEDFTKKMFDELKLGRDKIYDGLVIAFAVKDKKVRIEVGYGLEKIIRDDVAAQYIRDHIKPNFKEKKYYEGLSEVVSQIRLKIEANKDLIGSRL